MDITSGSLANLSNDVDCRGVGSRVVDGGRTKVKARSVVAHIAHKITMLVVREFPLFESTQSRSGSGMTDGVSMNITFRLSRTYRFSGL